MKHLLSVVAILLIQCSLPFVALAQAEGEILVAGNPPLTLQNANEIIKYYERGLLIEFTAGQREELIAKLSGSWKAAQKSNGKNLVNFLRIVGKINSWDEEKRAGLQNELTETVLADLKNSSRNDFNEFVLSVYESTRHENSKATAPTDESGPDTTATNGEATAEREAAGAAASDQPDDNFKPVGGTLRLADLAGKWMKDPYSVSTSSYTITTNDKGGYKNNTVYEIQPNGNFDFTANTTLYMSRCKTELFTTRKGRIAVSGSQANVAYISGMLQSKDNCSPRGNYTKPLGAEKADSPYRLERDGEKLRLCTVGTAEPNCLYKVKG